MRRWTALGLVACVVLVAAASAAQDFTRGPGYLEPCDAVRCFGWLVGKWEGEGAGFGSVSKVTHEWDVVLQEKFLRLRTRSVSVRADGSEDVHEDIGFLSRDTDHDAFVFRQFLSEGYVNTFTVVEHDEERQGTVFRWRESESAGGMRAEMLLTRQSRDEYEMVLSLAAPGKDFAACQTMTLKRVR